jgi:hypothetical protein
MWFRSFLTLGAVVGACLAGCNLGISADNASLPGGDDTIVDYDAGPSDATSDAPSSETGRPLYQSSPLCALTYTSACNPDDSHPDCAYSATADGGSRNGMPDSGGPSPYACRITIESGQPTATCTASSVTEPLGYSSSACTTGGDCAPGFDCVAEETIDGGIAKKCRHYCCAPSDCGGTSNTYCGIQALADNAGVNVPVCMPVYDCHLLGSDCTNGLTCTVVDEGGSGLDYKTSCVEPGNQGVGDSCELANCKANLACLGKPQQRQCWQICDADHPCASGMACTTGAPPYFNADAVSTFGICQ